jgi:hypothetical protein
MNSRAPHLIATLVFVAILLSAGAVQVGIALSRGETPSAFALFTVQPTVANLRAYEQRLETESWLARQLRPWMQYAQFLLFNELGENAQAGLDGWFFYKPGVEYLTQRQPVSTHTDDPVAAICHFRDQLAARGVHLVVMPAPNKESVYPERLSHRAKRLLNTLAVADANPSPISPPAGLCEHTRSLLRRLHEAGVEVVDLFDLFAREKSASATNGSPSLYRSPTASFIPAQGNALGSFAPKYALSAESATHRS